MNTAEGAKAFLPDPLPRALELPAALHRLVGEARDRLGALRGTGLLSRNPALFVNALQTREAAASSRIEGTKTTNEEALAHQVAALDTGDESDVGEVTNYLTALRQGVGELKHGRTLSAGLILGLHQTLMAGVRGQRSQPGKFRDKQNFVGSSQSIHEARFIPPPALHVPECLEALQRYLDTPSEDDPIVRAALVHYQFETIHPFEDGNGRIGRLIVALQTIQEKLQSEPLLYISSRLEGNRQEYYDRLLAVSLRGDFQGWVEFFVRAMLQSAEETTSKITKIIQAIRAMEQKLSDCSTPGPARIMRHIANHPFITVKKARSLIGASAGAAADAVAALEKRGVLRRARFKVRRRGRGRPPVLYYCPQIVSILK